MTSPRRSASSAHARTPSRRGSRAPAGDCRKDQEQQDRNQACAGPGRAASPRTTPPATRRRARRTAPGSTISRSNLPASTRTSASSTRMSARGADLGERQVPPDEPRDEPEGDRDVEEHDPLAHCADADAIGRRRLHDDGRCPQPVRAGRGAAHRCASVTSVCCGRACSSRWPVTASTTSPSHGRSTTSSPTAPASLALVGIAWSLPQVLLVLFSGVLADRLDRRRPDDHRRPDPRRRDRHRRCVVDHRPADDPVLVGLVVVFGVGQAVFQAGVPVDRARTRARGPARAGELPRRSSRARSR